MIRSQGGKPYHWVFLPGGPGLGSESLDGLTKILHLPGTIWHLDLPGDGSNLTSNDRESFSQWSAALVEALAALDNVILVAHSTGGMYALATEKLEGLLTGLILMDSAPDASWQQIFMDYVKQHPIAEVEALQKIYADAPDNNKLKELVIASAPYLFNATGLKKLFLFFKHYLLILQPVNGRRKILMNATERDGSRKRSRH
ncbi:alpha/beta fold hydrolase [Legionella tunisiensis]|uniref:alpha/beta fold hydrolase n=1 Tax=Legionella tunisiensis TaxID=1034944 RepID=UPI0002E3AB98|nr:alpha/beta hydrolase [Legionella tunisiensis]